MSTLIIGAGLSGLTAARQLTQAGREVIVLDKGRGVGGRLATRRGDAGLRFDHGAQYFTVRSAEFAEEVARWQMAGVAKIWADDFRAEVERMLLKPERYPRWCGTEGMAGIAKHLAEGLAIHTNSRVTRLEITSTGFNIHTDDGRTFPSNDVVMTCPVPQALELLDHSAIVLDAQLREALELVRYAPCLAALVTLKEPANIPEPGGVFCGPEPIAWIADQSQKGISAAPSVVIHAGREFSETHYQTDAADVLRKLLVAAEPYIGEVLSAELHRWKFSLPTVVYPERTAVYRSPSGSRLIFAGDAFGGPRVEGAFLSGRAAAAVLTSPDTRSVP